MRPGRVSDVRERKPFDFSESGDWPVESISRSQYSWLVPSNKAESFRATATPEVFERFIRVPGKGVYAQALMRLGIAGRFTAVLTTSARTGRLFCRIHRVLTEQGDDRAMKKTLLIGFAGCLLVLAGVRLDRSAVLAQPGEVNANSESPSDDQLSEGALVQLGSARLRHRSYVRQVAYSPDGRLIASRCVNNDVGVLLWNAQDGRHMRHLHCKNRRGWVEDFAFSPDGKWLVAAWLYKSLTLWEVSTGKLRWELEGDQAKAESVAFAPNNRLLSALLMDPLSCDRPRTGH